MYLALSRVTSIDNLFLIEKHNRIVFKVNESAVAEYNKIWENRFDTSNADFVDCNSLTVSLLNTGSLKRHTADISRNSNYKWYWCGRNQRAVKYFLDLFQFLWFKT